MAKFERVHFLRASLSLGEVHLYSFKGLLCKWQRGLSSSKETPIPIEGAALLGHVTNIRLIIEPREVDSLSIILREVDPKFLNKIASNMHLPIGYLSFDFSDMDHLGLYRAFACWPVMKYNMKGREPVFLPYTLYRVNHYTGVIVGPAAPDEFAEVIRGQGVSIVTYSSEAFLP